MVTTRASVKHLVTTNSLVQNYFQISKSDKIPIIYVKIMHPTADCFPFIKFYFEVYRFMPLG